MTTPEPESSPILNPVTGGIIVTLGLLLFGFFLISGQPFGLAFGAMLAFVVLATAAILISDREEIALEEAYVTTVPEPALQSAQAAPKLPSKLIPACSRCKSEIASTNKFCPECGHKLAAADFAPPSP